MTKLIAEVCQNHNGDRGTFETMVKAAAEAGADIVKMQSIFSEDLTRREEFEEGETLVDGAVKTIKRPYRAEFDRLSKLDLTLDDHRRFIELCKKYGVTPMTTIFARHRIREIGALLWPVRVVKVASYDCASVPFLRELAQHFDHLIISTGATYDEEIAHTAETLLSLGKKFSFLHCVTSYPNEIPSCHLKRMEWLRQFTGEVGWSDHTLVARDGISAAKAAIYLGADYVERHFTILDADKSKDGPVSITPALLKELSDFRHLSKEDQRAQLDAEIGGKISGWEKTLCGVVTREMTHTELLNRAYYRGRFASPRAGGGYFYNWEEA